MSIRSKKGTRLILHNLPLLVLKAIGTPVYRLGVPEQALGGIPLSFGIAVEDKPSELSCTVYMTLYMYISASSSVEIKQGSW